MVARRPDVQVVMSWLTLGCVCLSSLVFLVGCGREILHLPPPFQGDGFLVRGPSGASPEIEAVSFDRALSVEGSVDEDELYLVSFDETVLRALHPEAVLSDRSALRLYFSGLSAAECPFGEVPMAGRRGHALPDDAWRIFRLAEDRLDEVLEGPAWRASLRLEMPVEPGCGLVRPMIEKMEFPTALGKAFDRLIPIGGTRWIAVSAFGNALLLIDSSPPRILDEIRRVEDLGHTDRGDDLTRVEVDLEQTPPVVLLASTHGLFRFRIEGDELVFLDQSLEEHELLDLQLDPSGQVLAVGGSGIVLTAATSTGAVSGDLPLGQQRIERIRRTGLEPSPYLIFASRGRIYHGDPFLRPNLLGHFDPTVRGWSDVFIWRTPEEPVVFALDASGTIFRIEGSRVSSSTRVVLPPELRECAGPVVDACGFQLSETAHPRSVVVLDEPSADAPVMLVGFQVCNAVLAIEPKNGCVSVIPGLEPHDGFGTRWVEVSGDAVYYPSLDGSAYRWSKIR